MPPRQYHDAGIQTIGDQARKTVLEKVDSIIWLIGNYKWNIATFLLHFCTAQSPEQARTSKLWDAIFHTPALTEILLEHHGELGDLHVKPFLRCIEVELEAPISHRFGPFNPDVRYMFWQQEIGRFKIFDSVRLASSISTTCRSWIFDRCVVRLVVNRWNYLNSEKTRR